MAIGENVKKAGTLIGGTVIGYALDESLKTFADSVIQSSNALMKPSALVTYVGAFAPVLHAAYGHGKESTKLFEIGVSAYYVPQLLKLIRSVAFTAQPARMQSRAQSGVPPLPIVAPPTMYPAAVANTQAIF